MYIKTICISTFLFLNSLCVISQSFDIDWEKRIAKPGANIFNSIIDDGSGGYTVVGYAQASERKDMDFWIVRFSPYGDIIIDKTLGTQGNDLPSGISQFLNGDYILVGKTIFEDNSSQILFLKVDSGGNKIWQKNLSDIENTDVKNVIAMDDGSFVTCGTVNLSDNSRKIWLAKFDSEGNMAWEKTFGNNGFSEAESMKKLPDGGFAIAARVTDAKNQDYDLSMYRFDKDGKEIWDKHFESPNIKVWPECICCSPDSNLVVVGWYGTCMNDINSENPIFDYDLFLTKISPGGKVIWSKNIDSEGSEGGNAIVVRNDGKILIAGKKETSFLGRIGSWIVLTDPEGTMLKESVFPFNFGNDKASQIINSSDGGFVVIGPGDIDPVQQNSDGWIKKFRAF